MENKGGEMKFTVIAEITISLSTNVEAENEKEAIAKAEQRSLPTFCHFCGGDPDIEWATSGELDGVPTNLGIEE
jgi:hypothetical protein